MQLEHLIRAVTQEIFRLRVGKNDSALVIHHEYSIRRGDEHISGHGITEHTPSSKHPSSSGAKYQT
jgi:hypothetical protein